MMDRAYAKHSALLNRGIRQVTGFPASATPDKHGALHAPQLFTLDYFSPLSNNFHLDRTRLLAMSTPCESCVFCRICQLNPPFSSPHKETPHVLASFESCIAVLDIYPLTFGHTLIIPRLHKKKLFEHSQSELAALMECAKRTAAAVCVALKDIDSGPECFENEYNLVSNNGARAGQVVPHVHLHFVPRGDSVRRQSWRSETSSGDRSYHERAWKMFAKGEREELDVEEGETKRFIERARLGFGELLIKEKL